MRRRKDSEGENEREKGEAEVEKESGEGGELEVVFYRNKSRRGKRKSSPRKKSRIERKSADF